MLHLTHVAQKTYLPTNTGTPKTIPGIDSPAIMAMPTGAPMRVPEQNSIGDTDKGY